MYGPPTRRTGPQSTLIFIATVVCLGLALFLIGATIVLALIPVFISNNSVSANSNAFRSQNIIMSIEVQENAGGGRRKRDPGDLYSYVGGSLDDAGNNMIKTKLRDTLPSTKVSDLVISYCSLGYEASSTRERRALSKRAKRYSNNPIVLVCEFYIIFTSSCFYACQLNTGPTLRSTLYDLSLSTFVFTDVAIYKNGVFYESAPRIQCIRVAYVSEILPGSGSVTPAVPAVTVTLATTSTASAVTNTLTTNATASAATAILTASPTASAATAILTASPTASAATAILTASPESSAATDILTTNPVSSAATDILTTNPVSSTATDILTTSPMASDVTATPTTLSGGGGT